MIYKFLKIIIFLIFFFKADCSYMPEVLASSQLAGIISGVKGEVKILKRDSKLIIPATSMEMLNKNDEIILTKNSILKAIFFYDSHEEKITGNSIVVVTEKGLKLKKGSKKNLSLFKKVPSNSLPPNPYGSGDDIMGAVSRDRNKDVFKEIKLIKRISPLFTELSIKPDFKWSAVSEAEFYLFTLTNDNDIKIINNYKTSSNSLKFLKDTPPLKYGETYYWEIKAYKENKKISSGSFAFSIPKLDLANFIIKEEEKFKQLNKIDFEKVSSGVNLVILYLNYRLYDKAFPLLEKLAKIEPKNKNIQNMIKSIHELLHNKIL